MAPKTRNVGFRPRSDVRTMDTEDGRAARPPSGMDSDHDEMCWKSIMAIAPPAAAMASGSGDVAARPLPPGGESPNLASPFAHWWPSSELHVSLLAKVARFFNGFHRFPEAEEMELSEGEWDEIAADGEDATVFTVSRYQSAITTFLIKIGLVWENGMEKWYCHILVVPATPILIVWIQGGSPGSRGW